MILDHVHLALAKQLLLTIKQDRYNALITYGDLCERAGNIVTPRQSANYLGDLSMYCYERDIPLISVMVVNVNTFTPGHGFFKLYEQLTGNVIDNENKIFKEELRKLRKFNWEILAKALNLSIEFETTKDKDHGKSYKEGRVVLKQHLQRERNKQVVKEAKRLFLEKNGRLYCEICDFDFERVYGKLGIGIIEGHHVNPVSTMTTESETRIEDIMMVCANCHRVIHKNISLKLDDIVDVIKK